MAEKRLNIISVSSESSLGTSKNTFRSMRNKELQAKFERLWLIDPEQFNPLRNCMERTRLERTWDLITKHTNLRGKQIADIGCGAGVFSRRLRDAGGIIDAVDIAENALKYLKEENVQNIHPHQDAMPTTSLSDYHYDVIVCTEIIAELHREDYRLFFAELARLIKPNGNLICSSAIDIDSEEGVARFKELAQTEFELIDAIASYHSFYLKLRRFFSAPSKFLESWKDPEVKKRELASRRGINRWWFRLNTSPFLIGTWYFLEPLTKPFNTLLKNNTKILLILEKMCRFVEDDGGISHYIFIAKKRSIQKTLPEDIPVEHPRRKEIWT